MNQPAVHPLAQQIQVGSRRLSLDLWLALACCAGMVALCLYTAQLLIRPGVQAAVGGGDFGVALGWAFITVGLAFVSLGYAYGWVGARLLAYDPVGRWSGVALGATVVVSFALSHTIGAQGGLLLLVLLANLALIALLVLGPAVRANERSGRYSQVPLPIALSLVVSRAEAAAAVFVGLSLLAAQSTTTTFIGILLIGFGVTLSVAAQRLLTSQAAAAYLVGGLVALNALFGLVGTRNQLSALSLALALVVLWGLFGHPASRAFYRLGVLSPPQKASATGDASGVGPAVPPPPPGATPLRVQPPPPTPSAVAVPSPVATPAFSAPVAFAPAPPLAPPLASPPSDGDGRTSEPEPVTWSGVVETAAPHDVAEALAPRRLGLRCDGRTDIVIDGPTVLGRVPASPSEESAARLEPLPDPGRSLSRSHVLVRPAGPAQLHVFDLGSTNGTWILQGEATSQRLRIGETGVVEAGGVLVLGGDVTLQVVELPAVLAPR